MKFSAPTFVALAGAAAVHAAVFKEAVKFSKQLAAAAMDPDNGTYKFQNVASGQFMAYDNSGNTPNIIVADEGTPITLHHFGDQSYSLALGPDKDSARYCLSSQWDASKGFNIADTAYLCCASFDGTCDNGGNQGALRNAKQAHFLVPAESDAVAATSKAVQGLQKRLTNHISSLIRRHYRIKKQSIKRAAKVESKVKAGDVVYIIAVDHKDDMAQRAVTGDVETTAGDYKSLALAVVDADDDSQKWRMVAYDASDDDSDN